MSTNSDVRAVFENALERLARGDAPGAERDCRAVLAEQPDNVNILALLGAILLRLQRHTESEQCLRRVIELAPDFAKPREDLGLLLLESGRAEEAVAVLRRALHMDPSLEFAQFTLGKALAAVGDNEAADAAFDRAFDLAPWRQLLSRAVMARREGRLPDAEKLCKRVLQADADNVDALRLLASCALEAGRVGEGERLLRHAVSRAPDYHGALIDLGRLLKEQEQLAEAQACFDRVVCLSPDNPQAHFLRASTLAPRGRTEEAAAAYGRALELQPRNAAAWLGLGHVLKTLGRTDEGIAAYRKCIDLKPGNGEIWWSLANLKTYRFSETDIRHMRDCAEAPDADPLSRVNFLFALAKAAEDAGDFPQAWEDYRAANNAQRLRVSHDPVQAEQLADAIVSLFDGAFFAARKGWGDPERTPIFVLGLPRSGSTLIEQILASHSAVEGTGELPYIGRIATGLGRERSGGLAYPLAAGEIDAARAAMLGKEYLERAAAHRHSSRPYFVDKMPNNFPHVGLIQLILPNARIIDARRHPLDACVANYRQLYAKGQAFSYDLVELGEYWLQYHRLMQHWDTVLPGRVLHVDHEDLLGDLEGGVKRILAWCDLPFEPACLRYWETERAVRTPSSEQVRQPPYTNSIRQWKRYAPHLGELREILGSFAD